MLSKRDIFISGMGVCLFLSFSLTLTTLHAADTTEQIISQIDEILKSDPLPAGKKFHQIKVAEDDTITVFVQTLVEGAEMKRHLHKTHNHTIYVIKGTGRMLVNDKWIDIKPGTFHFNPMGKIHSTNNNGNEPLVTISIYTPAMREPDP